MKITITENKEQRHYKQTTNVLYNKLTIQQNNYIYTIMTIINAVSHNTDQGHLHTHEMIYVLKQSVTEDGNKFHNCEALKRKNVMENSNGTQGH